MSPLGTLLLPEPSVYPELSDLFAKPRNISYGISCSCSLLFDAKKINPLCNQYSPASFYRIPGCVGVGSVWSLATFAKSFRIRSYGNCTRNLFRIRSYKNTQGVGGALWLTTVPNRTD